MSIYDELDQFYSLDIEHYQPNQGIQNETLALRVSVDYEEGENGETIVNRLEQFLNDPKASTIKALVIGEWEEAYELSAQGIIDSLVANASKLPKLEALFVGEMTGEVNEISWIYQGDYSALWAAYPGLQHLQIRGSNDLVLGEVSHSNLHTLVIECGGMPASVIASISGSSLPALAHLELYLGDDNYGWDAEISDVESLLNSDKFPHLKTLGLRDCMEGDALATMVAANAFIAQLDVLDLSLGTIGDEGGKALLASPHIGGLKKLDLHFNYCSNDVAKQLSDLSIDVDVSDPQEDDDDYRYVAVSE